VWPGCAAARADGQGWCWQAPQPSGHWIEAVAFTSASDGWAVGDGGLLLRTRDGGAAGRSACCPARPALTSAVSFAPDGRQGWLLGAEGGRLWRTADGGDTWTAAPDLPLLSASSLKRADNGSLIVEGQVLANPTGAAGVVLVSDDAGTTWRDAGVGLLDIDADGTWWAFRKTSPFQVALLASPDGGLSFSRPVRGRPKARLTAGRPALAVMPGSR
jgi:photosystem II stability/assembly factor-like uncharacterized protein